MISDAIDIEKPISTSRLVLGNLPKDSSLLSKILAKNEYSELKRKYVIVKGSLCLRWQTFEITDRASCLALLNVWAIEYLVNIV